MSHLRDDVLVLIATIDDINEPTMRRLNGVPLTAEQTQTVRTASPDEIHVGTLMKAAFLDYDRCRAQRDAVDSVDATLHHPDVHHWWLSFVDRIDHMVACQLGVAIVAGRDIHDAVQNAWDYGCNPGGEVRAEQLPQRSIPRHLTHRLLTKPGDIAEAQLAVAPPVEETRY